MCKATFLYISEQLEPYIGKMETQPWCPIPVGKQLMSTLYRLATNCEFRTISNVFGIGKSTSCVIFHETCNAITQVLTPVYVFLL